jgi:uncharacterized membrane protein YdjX (TVP38/TMEM64 family)
MSQSSLRKNLIIALKILIVLAIGMTLIALKNYFDLNVLYEKILAWVRSLGALGPFAYILIYVFAAVFLLPGSLLTLLAGALFGLGWGTAYALVGATLGSIAAFTTGRYLARGWVLAKAQGNPKFLALDKAVASEGLKIVLLARLSPIFPFNFTNYAFGLTCVSLKNFALGSLGMIPGTFLYVYLGSVLGNLVNLKSFMGDPKTNTIRWVVNILGFLATIVLSLYMARIANKALNQSLPNKEAACLNN